MSTRTTYHVTGMTQRASADAVADRLSALPGVHEVWVDIVAGTALVASDTPLDRARVRAAMVEAGCELAPEPGARVGRYLGGLAVALVAGFALGHAVSGGGTGGGGPGGGVTPSGSAHPPGVSASSVAGLAISDQGYTVVPVGSTVAGTGVWELFFVIKDAQGRAVTRFATVQDRSMHLVVVRRDLVGYRHLHPTMAPDGTWSATVTLPEPGPWRAYTDFAVVNASGAQVPLALGYDIVVTGDYQPRRLPPVAREVTVDGYAVAYEGTPGTALTFRVSRNGTLVTDLQPHFGSFGHLVVLRGGDLGYVHVHPEPRLIDGAVRFSLSVAGPGTYRMYFDFQVEGRVRTAEFTLTVA